MELLPVPGRVILLNPHARQLRATPPPGYENVPGLEQCGVLDALVLPAVPSFGTHRICIWWQPDEEERKGIAEGDPIFLTIVGSEGIPVMAMDVGYPEFSQE